MSCRGSPVVGRAWARIRSAGASRGCGFAAIGVRVGFESRRGIRRG